MRGFKFKGIRAGLKLRPIIINETVPIETQTNCPACSSLLTVFCSLFNKTGSFYLRTGLCHQCGYGGYIDRPTERWLIDFYAHQWDAARKTVTKLDSSHELTLAGISHLNIDKNKPVLEIGCGYGAVLQRFSNLGFKDVTGIDPSIHRIKTAGNIHNITALVGNFGDNNIQERLRRHSPFGLIFNHHVIEHVFDPRKFIKLASDLQDRGDYLITALPNVVAEHAGYNVFYLPHLHAFTKKAVETLLNNFNYEIIKDCSPNNFNSIIIAQKVIKPKSYFKSETNYERFMIDKFIEGLALKQSFNNQYYWCWDGRDKGEGGDTAWVESANRPLVLDKLIDCLRFDRLNYYCFLVEPIQSYRTVFPASPFEIQFEKDIQLLVK